MILNDIKILILIKGMLIVNIFECNRDDYGHQNRGYMTHVCICANIIILLKTDGKAINMNVDSKINIPSLLR